MIHTKASQLTEHEIRILSLVAQGLTNKEIAWSLKVKERTVEFHMHNIFERLEVSSRTAAVVCAHKLKLLDI